MAGTPGNKLPSTTPEPIPVGPGYNIPDPLPIPPPAAVPVEPPIVNRHLPDPKVLAKLATPPAPRQLSVVAGKRGDPEPYAFGHCIVDPVLIAADDSGSTLVMDMLWSVGEIDYFEGLFVDRIFEGRADMLGNMEHFEGTTGQAASTILTALKGSYDTLTSKAHSVLRWRSEYATLQIQGWVRGLKLFDPRLSPQAFVYSKNPALALARILVDCGYTMNWASVAAAADYCDELIGSPNVKRWEIGGQITRRGTAKEWISTLALYANCFVDRIGSEVYLIPDKPRSSNHTVTADDMILDTIRITHAGGRNVPAAVTVIGQSFEGDLMTGVYVNAPISYIYGTPDGAGTVTELQMPWLQTVHACGRMAEQIYRKAHNDMTLEFVGFDDGLQRTIGDVGTITNAAFDLSSELMTLIENEQVSRGRWRRKYVQYNAANYSDVIYTGTSNDTTLSNPFSPPTGPTPTLGWQYSASSPTFPILTLSWTGVSWAYIKDYFVRVYSSDSPEVVIYDTNLSGFITHAAGTITLDLSAIPVQLGNTYTADIYIRSNVNAVGAIPGTASVTATSPILWSTDPLEVARFLISDDSTLTFDFSASIWGILTQYYGSEIVVAYAPTPQQTDAIGEIGIPQLTNAASDFGAGEYLWKYEVVSVDAGSSVLETTSGTGDEGNWLDLYIAPFTADFLSLPYGSTSTLEQQTVDVTLAIDNGAGAPVSGTEVTKRITFINYQPHSSEILVLDDLDEGSPTSITSHTPDVGSGSWTVDAGGWSVTASDYAEATGADSRAVYDVGVADCSITAEFRFYANSAGLIGRRQDASNYWLLSLDSPGTADPVLRLTEVTAGTPTVRASVTLTNVGPMEDMDFTEFSMRLMFNGNDIRGDIWVWLTGQFTVEYTSSSFNTETEHGIAGSSTTAATRCHTFTINDFEQDIYL